MDKKHIIDEIRRTAKANEGSPLGWRRFAEETGIKYHDWYGQFWTGWGDAVREAGLEPNRLPEAYDEGFLLEKLALLSRQLRRVPALGHILLARKNDPTFPSENAFRRFGKKHILASRIIAFCSSKSGYDDVSELWSKVAISKEKPDSEELESSPSSFGYVYLLKHGSRQEYKIGRTINPVRREGEIGIALPEKISPVHHIKTDDPAGIETYWHKRFANKRKEGEWFALTAQDVRAFKKWKRIF